MLNLGKRFMLLLRKGVFRFSSFVLSYNFHFLSPTPSLTTARKEKKGRETRRGYIRRFKNLRDSHSI